MTFKAFEGRMDELSSAFTSGLAFESKGTNADLKSDRGLHSCLHKARGTGLSSQEERRRRNLQLQKEKRKDYLAHVRKLVDAEEEQDGDGSLEDVNSEKMDSQSASRGNRRKKKRYMAGQLMLSEWMFDVPPDLEENWCMVACPKGNRAVVTTSRGCTRAFKKNGYCFKRFPSHLPAGLKSKAYEGKAVVLDCIFNEAQKTFYVIDVMCWMGHPVYDSDTEFRFFWLQAKFSEIPHIRQLSNFNPYAFIPLPSYTCSKSTMESVMARKMPFEADLDGILFYHKHTHYTLGHTPLVGWLKPWMLPEVLGVSIPQHYIDSKPPDEPWKPPVPTSEMECSDQGTECTKDGSQIEHTG